MRISRTGSPGRWVAGRLPALLAAGLMTGTIAAPAMAKPKPPSKLVAPAPTPTAPGDGSLGPDQPGGPINKVQTGHAPQSVTPLGAIDQPPSQQVDQDGKSKEMVQAFLVSYNTPSAEISPEARAIRAAIQKRDARIAARNLPKREMVAGARG